ncbi:MAG: sulfatase-like hydrolase/transferase, partial [Lentisphaerae bacterium]|nr:sulfatase-like hydrolase/transferase [Lentisphaerota bacterium]
MKTTVLLLVLFLAGSAIAAAPNVLWIITDDHRADSIEAWNRATSGKSASALGYVSSPQADRLAGEGVLFTRAYCNSPGCAPSRTSMHYGMYPHRSGHFGFEKSYQNAAFTKPTLPQLMSKRGYSTAHFGKRGFYIFKWIGKPSYTDAGFYDVSIDMKKDLGANRLTDWTSGQNWKVKGGPLNEIFWGFPGEPALLSWPVDRKAKWNAKPPAEVMEKTRQIDERLGILRSYTRSNPNLILGGVSPQPTDKTMDGEITAAFEAFLSQRGRAYTTPWQRDVRGPPADKPLMVHLGYHFPHTPVLPSKEFRDRFSGCTYRVPEFNEDELKTLPPQLLDLHKQMNFSGMEPEEKQQAIRDYYAFCAMGDSLVGRAVDAFRDFSKRSGRGYLILYVIGDHGWHLGEQGIEAKFAPYDTSNHCAVIAVSSDKETWPAGKVSHELVEFVDFSPTILRAGGADLKEKAYAHLDGLPLDDTLHGRAHRDYVIGEMNQVIGPRAYLRSD